MRVRYIDFMKWRKVAIALSAFLMIGSIVLLFTKGLNLGIDFTGGNVVQVEFPQAVEVGAVRDILTSKGQGNALIQAYSDTGLIIRMNANDDDVRKDVVDALQTQYPGMQVTRLEKVGPVVGSELRREAYIALSLALAGILIYVTVRFQFRIAMVSVLALVHDVLITVGATSLFNIEVSSTFIAAILTIVGYSLNDSIVIFDRVRENWRELRTKGILQLVNDCINQTLSRTINTSLTTLMPVLCLYILGGEVLRTFSFAMLIGLIAGIFSTLFIATGVLVEWWIRSPRKDLA
ncbi:MAG TPA: protein translocase subunit SecF [Synergistaceae bacterium]|nr:protein translocase subunit SecF [Synergistaceae bacterium]